MFSYAAAAAAAETGAGGATGKKKQKKKGGPFPITVLLLRACRSALPGCGSRYHLPPQACFPFWKTCQISSLRKQLYLGKKTGKTEGGVGARLRGHGAAKNNTKTKLCHTESCLLGFFTLTLCLFFYDTHQSRWKEKDLSVDSNKTKCFIFGVLADNRLDNMLSFTFSFQNCREGRNTGRGPFKRKPVVLYLKVNALFKWNSFLLVKIRNYCVDLKM